MTAHELISDIFARPQTNVAGNQRFITRQQLKYLRDLIDADKERSAFKRGVGADVWTPSGPEKFVLAEDVRPGRHTLTRLPGAMGSLF